MMIKIYLRKFLRPVIIVTWVFVANASLAGSNSLEQAMYFKSQVHDAEQCSMFVREGKVVFNDAITNPAITCPDAFAWKKLLETIKDEFWVNWAYDEFTYPSKPYAICSLTDSDESCCDPYKNNNPGYDINDSPAEHCPYFPGDHLSKTSKKHNLIRAKSPFKQHFSHTQTGHNTLISKVDPGRAIRQEMAEVVFRNKAMWSYNFINNLYNKDGLGDVYKNLKFDIKTNAPYHRAKERVSFPTDSIMFKTDWLHEDEAKALGLTQDKEHPYITMYMKSPTGDNNANNGDQVVFREGLHYLMAITAASKDLPNWHWYAIEHVNNLGRCDYTGCNDSFGYHSQDKVPEGYSKNYVVPKTINDGLVQSSPIFDTGKTYPAEKISPELNEIFKKLMIGQEDSKNKNMPSVSDRAWLSYRLKGVQTEFISDEGVNTILGNSVTEGGFVNTSSCITCHAQAVVDQSGSPAIGSIGFSDQMNLLGYPQSSNGAPSASWYYQPGTTTPLNAKIDFVWGILFANPLVEPE
ncbi:MAG: hypothetical protein KBT75_04915 [Oleispira antarctica]|nr:hypothetical protein [Oleispira antarctica]MBQ0792460.1 hypothetical protein [Oleispira antarctica]|tara:strand:- start:2623 stop:4185 length:1563 start_codon:yes stop_codon:yes gene_type:complete